MARILLASNGVVGQGNVQPMLVRHGYEVLRAGDTQELDRLANSVDLVILRVNLPDLDTVETCRKIRHQNRLPVIVTALRGSEIERVICLRAGADAYLTHPFTTAELIARADTILRRTRPRARSAAVPDDRSVRVDPATREVLAHDRLVSTTRKEFDLLLFLMSAPGIVLTRRQIMRSVWKDDWGRATRTIDVHVRSLRKKLGDAATIETVRGVGFRMVLNAADPADVSVRSPGPHQAPLRDVV